MVGLVQAIGGTGSGSSTSTANTNTNTGTHTTKPLRLSRKIGTGQPPPLKTGEVFRPWRNKKSSIFKLLPGHILQ